MLVQIVSLFISAVALCVAVLAHVREHRLSRRMVALEESREKARIQEGAKAHLVADLQRNDRSWRLTVKNAGRSEARDMVVLLDGQPILNHPGVAVATKQGLNRELSHLPAGAVFRYVLSPTLSCRPPWELEVTWHDDSGEPGSYKMTLTL